LFEVVVGSRDPDSYAEGNAPIGRAASHSGQDKGDDLDYKGYPGPPGWGLGMGLVTPTS